MAETPLEVQIGEIMTRRGLTLAVAESCTGGLVSHHLTNVPGSSVYFLGGIVTYANQAKMELLGVRASTLASHGAVSKETVLEMARGVRRALEADIGVAVSGIAGPGGATPGKPVGLVWIGLSAGDASKARSAIWPGDRLAVKEQSAQAALQLVMEYLIKST
jgi:PncC family amidohydrolase